MDRADHLHDILTWLDNTIPPPTEAGASPLETNLAQNYPNPFNPSTTIRYTLRETSHVTLRVYNVSGQLVRTLVDGEQAGQKSYSAEWDGRNNRGQNVSSGIYFYRLEAGEFTNTKKMLMLK
jgi:hypothetical protein